MKRILMITLCCLGAAALLCSCGNGSGKKADQDKAAADSLAAAEQTQRTMEKIAQLP